MAEAMAIVIVMVMMMTMLLVAVAAVAAVCFPLVGKLIRPVITALWVAREAKAFREDPRAHARAHLDRRVQAEAKRRAAKSRRPRRARTR